MSDDVYSFALRDWQANFEIFNQFFLRQTQAMANTVGYSVEPDHEAIRIAHQNWVAQCAFWKKERVPPGTSELSHLKILAILLHQLVSVDWAPTLYDCSPPPDSDRRFVGKEQLRQEIRDCINAGRGTYLAFQFVIRLVNWFEANRRDRKSPFVFRLTPDLEHDLMYYLASEGRDEVAIFLILKALYARDGERAN